MTREEAISVLERVAHTESKWPGTEDTLEALDMAISALRHQETVTNRNGLNDPMTLDELREMDGEPVWTENNTVHGKFYAWSLVDAKREQVRNANGFVKYFSMYGKEWIAYRQKPEEGTV